MKAKQLIEILSQYPENTVVLLQSPFGGYSHIQEWKDKEVEKNKDFGSWKGAYVDYEGYDNITPKKAVIIS